MERSGQTRLVSGETVIYSGHEDEDHEHTQGVAIMMSPEATNALIAWEPVSPRLIAARFNAKGRKTTLIQCYAPTKAATDEEKEDFYSALQAQIDKSPKRDIKIVMGDMNAKVGTENKERELTMGKNGIGTINENGELFADFCAANDLIIGGTIFSHKDIHKTTWTSPDGKTKNQIDHITVSRKCPKIKEDFNCAVKNRYEVLSSLVEDTVEETVEQKWLGIQELWKSTCTDILGRRKNEQKEWITTETWAKIEDRKEIKQKINKCKDEKEKINLRTRYCEVNRMVRKSAKEDKRQFIQEMIEEAETAARQGKMKRLYEVTRTLSGKNINPNKPVTDKVGNILTSDTEQRDRWVQHFDEISNHPLSSNIPDIPPANHLLDVCTDPPTKLETRAIKNMKNGKAASPDGIPPEALKADPAISADILHPLLKQIWEEEIIPSDWKLGYLIKLLKK
ncbi:uncharacterized protein LOC131944848 [Physella acuta]|uniref:uncharacterized protein LOC131944848 n=1 Tax=Physella acuta TaxID=109671 RepID=UPI0027DCFF9F|nr:uncharacterized protein LOC131944848 [Physella acuta]